MDQNKIRTCFQSVSMYEHKATDNSSGKSVSVYTRQQTTVMASYLLLVVLQQLVLVVLVLELLLELLPPQLQFLWRRTVLLVMKTCQWVDTLK